MVCHSEGTSKRQTEELTSIVTTMRQCEVCRLSLFKGAADICTRAMHLWIQPADQHRKTPATRVPADKYNQ